MWYLLFRFATIANVLSLEGVMGAKCSKHFLFSNLMSWCNSSDNSYTRCFISDIKFCFRYDESNLYFNFVQVQNIMINIVDFVFTFACDFYYYCHLIQWYPRLFFLSRLFFDKYFNIVEICIVISSVFSVLYLF